MKGSCCCGAVAYELTAPPTMMATCHCTRCRKLGASTFVFVRRDAFTLLRGAESIATMTPEPPYRYERSFCRHCGTALGELNAVTDSFPINAHTLDAEPGLSNRFHEFVAEKPEWLVIGDAGPQFPGHPQKAG